jgi:hypothetical protein
MIEVYGNKSIAGPVILIDTGKHRLSQFDSQKLRGSGRVRIHALVDRFVSKDRRL